MNKSSPKVLLYAFIVLPFSTSFNSISQPFTEAVFSIEHKISCTLCSTCFMFFQIVIVYLLVLALTIFLIHSFISTAIRSSDAYFDRKPSVEVD